MVLIDLGWRGDTKQAGELKKPDKGERVLKE